MKSAKKNKVGFIGLGIMGKPMVINLINNDIEVYFYARKKRIIDEILKIGGKFIPNPSDISKFTKIILTNLPNTKDVEDIVIGKNGIINNLQTGSIVIDMSTISPEGTRYINDKLRARKSYLLDAPVSGGTKGAENGSLAIMVGGNSSVFNKVEDAFKPLGRAVFVGPVGSGQLAKLANQAIVAITIGAVAEATLLLEEGGADVGAVRVALVGGFADSTILQQHGKAQTQ